MPGEDSQKLSQEYLEYQQKLEQQKQDYRKEHPDEAVRLLKHIYHLQT